MFRTQKRIQNLEHLLKQAKDELKRAHSEARLQDKLTLFTTNLITSLHESGNRGEKGVYSVIEDHFDDLENYATGLFAYQSSYLSLKAATVPGGLKRIRELERISDYKKGNFNVPVEDSPYLKKFCAKPAISDVGFNRLVSQMVHSYLASPIAACLDLKEARVTLYPLIQGKELKGIFTISGKDDPDIVRPYMEIISSTLTYVLYGQGPAKNKSKRL